MKKNWLAILMLIVIAAPILYAVTSRQLYRVDYNAAADANTYTYVEKIAVGVSTATGKQYVIIYATGSIMFKGANSYLELSTGGIVLNGASITPAAGAYLPISTGPIIDAEIAARILADTTKLNVSSSAVLQALIGAKLNASSGAWITANKLEIDALHLSTAGSITKSSAAATYANLNNPSFTNNLTLAERLSARTGVFSSSIVANGLYSTSVGAYTYSYLYMGKDTDPEKGYIRYKADDDFMCLYARNNCRISIAGGNNEIYLYADGGQQFGSTITAVAIKAHDKDLIISRIIFPDGTIQVSSPTGGGGGGGAAVYPDIDLCADDFKAPYSAFSNTGTVSYFETASTFSGMTSTTSARFGRLFVGVPINFIESKKSKAVPRGWANSSTNCYLTLSGTGTITTGNVVIHVMLSTCPISMTTLNAAVKYEILESTIAMTAGDYNDINTTIATASNAILTAGKHFWTYIRRVATVSDTCPQDVIFKAVVFSKH